MEKEILISNDAPKAIGPYSSAVRVGRLTFVSGQLPIDAKTGEILEGDIEKQTKKAIENLITVLKPYGLDVKNIVKINVFIKDMNDFSRVNKVYSEYFTSNFPARSFVQVVNLPKDSDIEIEAIAYE